MDQRKTKTEQRVAEARRVLRGGEIGTADALTLAKDLCALDAHYWARRLLLKLLQSPTGLRHRDVQELSQSLALATYKDPSLLRDQAFETAIAVLDQAFDLDSTDDQETLGLAGAVYKRRWQLDGRRLWLERSLHFYRRGFECGVEQDLGYTAVNAAFVQDLLAHVEQTATEGRNLPGAASDPRRNDARAIREAILAALEAKALALPGSDFNDYWPIATLAEVYFGLGQFDKAGEQLARAAAVPGVAEWMRKSTVEQLVQLTQVQLGTGAMPPLQDTPQWAVIRRFIPERQAAAAQTLFCGKVGLALSGGGFRASLYHLGVLAKLAELDLLRHVEALSCVSGGSIVGAHYYLELRRLLQFAPRPGGAAGAGRHDHEISQQDYLDLVAKLIDDFLDGIQKNLRMRILANPLVNLKMLFLPTYSRTERLGELYEQHLYSRVADAPPEGSNCPRQHRWLSDLFIQPPDEAAGYRPADVNWRRYNKIPHLVLNATTLNTGHAWQFTASWMGESPNIIDRDVDKNPRFGRLYYEEAPARYRCFRLGHAVAASSCVPGLFEPIELPALYQDTNVRLVDGGVYDNLGVASLAEQGCNVMIVSDASGQLNADDDPAGGMLGPLMRSTSVMMGRVRGAAYDDLRARRRSGLLQGLTYVHLTHGLEAQDIGWLGSEVPGASATADAGHTLTDYGIRRDVQQRLAAVRTDLDSFSDIEAFALMNSGYQAMGMAAKQLSSLPLHSAPPVAWAFRELAAPMASANAAGPSLSAATLDRHLRASHLKFFKVWRLSPWLSGIAILAGLALLAALASWLIDAWQSGPDRSLLSTTPAQALLAWAEEALTLRNLLVGTAFMIGGYLTLALFGRSVGKRLSQFFKLRSILQRAAIGIGVGIFGWVLAGLHLWVFDRLFIRLGRLRDGAKGRPRVASSREKDATP